MNVLAIIPARGGSKRIPYKNIQNLAGKPLIAHTIIAAKKSKVIDKIVVSTDDKKIAKISEAYGIEVPFLRPKNISKDNSPTIEAVKHTLEFLRTNQDYIPDMIIILQPTSPLRTTRSIDNAIKILRKSKSSCVITVSKIKKHPSSAFWLKSGLLKQFKQKTLQNMIEVKNLQICISQLDQSMYFGRRQLKNIIQYMDQKLNPY